MIFVSRLGRAALLLATAFAAGAPAVTAQESPCARANTDPVELQKTLTGTDKLPEVFRDDNYLALQDKSTWAVWTFTQPSNPAHPAVVCRRPVQEGDTITLDMVINCKGDGRACAQLDQDFRALNAKMAQEMNAKK